MHSQNTDKPKIAQGIRFTTRHAFLVLAGAMAHALGLRSILESGLQIKQKVYSHTSLDKVLQALIGILGGNRYMKDLNYAASPVAKDGSVARAWGIRAFAHFSTVCRTLRAFTADWRRSPEPACNGSSMGLPVRMAASSSSSMWT